MNTFIIIEAITENQEKQSVKEIIIKIESWGRWTYDRNGEIAPWSFPLRI